MTMKFQAGRSVTAAVAALAMLVFSGIQAVAADQARLTTANVKQFLASYPTVKAIAVRHAKANGQEITGGKEALAAVVQAASNSTIKSEIATAARAHGFRDVSEWSSVGQHIAMTYAHLKLAPSDQKNQQKLDKTIAKIQKNDLLSEKAKRKLIDAIRSGADAVEPPPADDVAVVKPLVPEIDAVVKK